MSDPASQLEPGQVLDERYELLGEIARGGFGLVYRARQLNMDREVAIKMVPPKFMDLPDVVQRFEREARLASRLSHPNTVTVHDYGQFEDHLYLVMELLEGEDLADILARERDLKLERIAHIGRQVLKSLNEAHQHNIIHRDLKPENIFLTEISGEKDFVKVVDFGIAKLAMSEMESDRQTARSLTIEGNTVGTPTYMSPEQAAGGEVDARSDLYALGVMMYEMAAGEPPFDHEEPAKLMRLHIFEEVPDFPDESLEGCWLEPVVERAMAKEKEDRFQDAQAFIDAIDYAVEASNDDRAFAPTREQSAVDASEENLAEESLEIVGPNPSGTRSAAHTSPSAYDTPSDGPDFGSAADRHGLQAPSREGTTASSIMTVLEPSPDEEVIVLDKPKEGSGDVEGATAPTETPPEPERANPPPEDHAASERCTEEEGGRSEPHDGDPNRGRKASANRETTTDDRESHGAAKQRSKSNRSPPRSEAQPSGDWEWSGEDETGADGFDEELETDFGTSSTGARLLVWGALLAGIATAAYMFLTGAFP